MATLLDAYWRVCLLNESGGEGNALSDAGMDSDDYGYSFGVKQFDLLKNDEAGRVLAKTLEAVVGDPGCTVTAGEIAEIRGDLLKRKISEVDESGTLRDLVARINVALTLQRARDRLSELTRDWMAGEVDRLSADVATISNDHGARDYILESTLAQLLLLDYKNLFGDDISTFKDLLCGEEITRDDGRLVAAIEGTTSLSDLLRYVLSTKQGHGPGRAQRPEILRRLNNVIHIGDDPATIELTEKDRRWLVEELSPMLDSENEFVRREREDGEYDTLLALIEQAR